MTYMQVRDEKKQSSSLLRTSINYTPMPTSFFLRVIEPTKEFMESNIQLRMIGDLTLQSLPDIFSDMLGAQNCDESMMQLRNISFTYHNQNIASVILNKNSKDLQVMTNEFDHQWLVLRELTSSMETKFRKSIHQIVSFDDKIPLTELFETIDIHFNIRLET